MRSTTPDAAASPHLPGTSFEVPAWSEWAALAGQEGPVRAFTAILTGVATSRSALSTLLQVRSTTVSAWVTAMIRARLVTELPSTSGGRGRPQGQLVANPSRLAVSVLMVRSQALHAFAVNLMGQVLWRDSAVLPRDCGNDRMRETLRALQQQAAAHLPASTALAGVSYSLSGLVSVANATWMFASRWPSIRNLSLRDEPSPPDVALHVVRNMDAQLLARCLRRGVTSQTERTLMLHWGYGIGATFSAGGGSGIDSTAGFGEVGHWQLSGQGLRCCCGRTGCLETVAALWAIGPELLGERFDDAMDESQASELLHTMALMEQPVFANALKEVVLALSNLCRTLAPTHVVVSGPFVDNPGAWAAFTAAFANQGQLVDLPMPRLEVQSSGHQLELEGASMPLLLAGVVQVLNANEQG